MPDFQRNVDAAVMPNGVPAFVAQIPRVLLGGLCLQGLETLCQIAIRLPPDTPPPFFPHDESPRLFPKGIAFILPGRSIRSKL